jgi:hypothetical protein
MEAHIISVFPHYFIVIFTQCYRGVGITSFFQCCSHNLLCHPKFYKNIPQCFKLNNAAYKITVGIFNNVNGFQVKSLCYRASTVCVLMMPYARWISYYYWKIFLYRTSIDRVCPIEYGSSILQPWSSNYINLFSVELWTQSIIISFILYQTFICRYTPNTERNAETSCPPFYLFSSFHESYAP